MPPTIVSFVATISVIVDAKNDAAAKAIAKDKVIELLQQVPGIYLGASEVPQLLVPATATEKRKNNV